MKEKISHLKITKMDETVLLFNVSKYCEDMHPTWKFTEGIAENLIKECAQQNWQSCMIKISDSDQKEFDLAGETIRMLLGILSDSGFKGIESVTFLKGCIFLNIKSIVSNPP